MSVVMVCQDIFKGIGTQSRKSKEWSRNLAQQGMTAELSPDAAQAPQELATRRSPMTVEGRI
jgi:hypothetical protein